MRRRATGFTFIEILMAMTIVGLLSSVAVPKYRDMKRRALATNILGDFQVVRIAALSFFADSGYFPPDAPPGTPPRNLGTYLPQGFTFSRDEWSLDYEHFPGAGPSGDVVGVAAATLDEALGIATMAMLGNNATIMINGKLTFFISGT